MKKWIYVLLMIVAVMMVVGCSSSSDSENGANSDPIDPVATNTSEPEAVDTPVPTKVVEEAKGENEFDEAVSESTAVPTPTIDSNGYPADEGMDVVESTEPDGYPANETEMDTGYPVEENEESAEVVVPEIQLPTLKMAIHENFDIDVAVYQKFSEQSGYKIELVQFPDAFSIAEEILTNGTSDWDLVYGLDNLTIQPILDSGFFTPYNSPLLSDIKESLQLDPENRALPVNYAEICPNYDVDWFHNADDLDDPMTLDDLIDPAYDSLTILSSPVTSTAGLGFLIATIQQYGEDGYIEYWEKLVANNVAVSDYWSESYRGFFTPYGGPRPIVGSYSTFPAAEMMESDLEISRSIIADNSCFRQVEFVGIVADTPNLNLAKEWVDFMLEPSLQENIAREMYMIPANETAEIPSEFTLVPRPSEPVNPLDMATIEENKAEWISAWEAVVKAE